MAGRIYGVAVIVENYDETYLLHLRDGNARVCANEWSLIGGRVEGEETPEEAVKREVYEESNLVVQSITPLREFFFVGKPHMLFHATVDTTQDQLEVREGKDFKFFTKEEARELVASLSYESQYLNMLIEYDDLSGLEFAL